VLIQSLPKLVPNKSREIRKTEIINRLVGHLTKPFSVRRHWYHLHRVEQDALLTLMARHGSAPYKEFTQRFGAFAVSHRKRHVPTAKTNSTLSPTARLAQLGWIYPFTDGKDRTPTHVVIPRELIHYLPRPVLRSHPRHNTPELHLTDLLVDLTLLLAHLHYTPTPRRHRGVPPLAALRTINRCLRLPTPMEGVRRADQAGRTTFLMFLVEALGMVDPDTPIFTLTPQTWQ
jgi:hypothetical protein